MTYVVANLELLCCSLFLLVAILVAEHVQLQQEIGECEGDEHMQCKIVNEKQA